MTICTIDGQRSVSIGNSSILLSLYSTAIGKINNCKTKYPLAIQLLETLACKYEDATTTKKQVLAIKQEFLQISPEESIYDINHPETKAPWIKNINPSITSCADLFTTEDGLNLLDEFLSILEYSNTQKTDIIPCF